ncbi:hypothetical protein Ccrd_025718, partial [Cynara cardunculus var. scolymus]
SPQPFDQLLLIHLINYYCSSYQLLSLFPTILFHMIESQNVPTVLFLLIVFVCLKFQQQLVVFVCLQFQQQLFLHQEMEV